MLLRNFYNSLSSWMEGKAPTELIVMNGTTYSYTTTSNITKTSDQTFLKLTRSNLNDFYFGDGDTEPTLDDYTLSGNRITTLTGTVNSSRETDDTGTTITMNFTLTNTGTSAVTIKEIGLGASFGSSIQAMIFRDVLSNPITLEPNGVGQITHTVKLAYPTA